jgi:hypothetical protein
MGKRVLPEQEKRNYRSKFECGVGLGRSKPSSSSSRNHCIDGLNRGDLIYTLGTRIDGGHGKGEARGHFPQKGNNANFLKGV